MTNNDKKLNQAIRLRVLLIAALSFVLLIISTKTAHSQALNISVYAEQNVIGMQKGVEAGFLSRKNLQIAYFFQATDRIAFEGNDTNYPFHGLSLSAPIKQCDGLRFSAGMKTGFVNGKYLIITPQLITEIKIAGPLHIGFTAGYRAGHAAIGSKLSFNI